MKVKVNFIFERWKTDTAPKKESKKPALVLDNGGDIHTGRSIEGTVDLTADQIAELVHQRRNGNLPVWAMTLDE